VEGEQKEEKWDSKKRKNPDLGPMRADEMSKRNGKEENWQDEPKGRRRALAGRRGREKS